MYILAPRRGAIFLYCKQETTSTLRMTSTLTITSTLINTSTVEDVYIYYVFPCTMVYIVYRVSVQMYGVYMYNYSTVAPAIKYYFNVLPIIEVSRYNW